MTLADVELKNKSARSIPFRLSLAWNTKDPPTESKKNGYLLDIEHVSSRDLNQKENIMSVVSHLHEHHAESWIKVPKTIIAWELATATYAK